MEWFYAEGQSRKGPVGDAELSALVASGTIKPDTLVWNVSFTDWRPASVAGVIPPALGSSPAAESHVCIVTGKTFPASQMIQTEHGWVSAEGRDTYYQCLREGVPISTSSPNARADGRRIVVPATGARLPLRCIKTNEPVTEADVRARTLWWCPPLVIFTILLNLLITLILYFVLRKSVKLDIPLSRRGRQIVRRNALIAFAAGALGFALVIFPIASGEERYLVWLPAGAVVVIGALIFGALQGTALRIVKFKNQEVWLAGAGRDYLASLPRYRVRP
jgi:hypothetical protein